MAEIPVPRPGATVRGGELDGWLAKSADPDPRVRARAAQFLCPCHVKADRDKVWSRVLDLFDDADPKVRGIALHAMGDGSPRRLWPEIVARLEARYNDPDRRLRRHIRRLLAVYRRTGELNVL